MKIIKEHFDSIGQMLSVIESRPNNEVMKNEHASESTNHLDWYGNATWEQAKDLFQYGYTDVLEKIKEGLAKTNVTQVQNRRRVTTGVVGYAPHVPNAILGLPNSMIQTHTQPQKVKAISIVYNITGNSGVSGQEIIDSGVAILNVINRLELQGIRVNLEIIFKCSKEADEAIVAMVKVKDYREHMDIKKLCFPIAHPSMFRRFGFKWTETVPGITNSGWSFGYGCSTPELYEPKENEFYFHLKKVKEFNYDADKIIESLNLKKS